MTARKAIRLWPPVGVLAMLLLGRVVGPASTPVDEAVLNAAHAVLGQHPSWLLVFTDWWLLGPVLAGCLAVAVVSLLAILGEIACRFHYFTDTIGAVLLGSAVVCLGAQLAGSLPAPRGSPLVSPPVCAPPDKRPD